MNATFFASVQRALVDAGICQPVLVIDRERLDCNLDLLAATAPTHMGVRIVVKSLPSLELLHYVMGRLGTNRLMTFNLPMLIDLARAMPAADQLLGKPFPVVAAEHFYSQQPVPTDARVQWLIDTNERLEQYDELAQEVGIPLRVSLELDVGLHRGGFTPNRQLRTALKRIADSSYLEFAGYMGYDAHVAKIPAGRLRTAAFNKAVGLYATAVEMAEHQLGDDVCADAIWNSAGSLTYPMHKGNATVNEMSIGSALLKGTDFDTDLLGSYQPAVFIATPVLKVLPATQIPGLEFVGKIAGKLGRPSNRAIFIHGGHWLAKPAYPAGLSNNYLYGRSSNQEMLNTAGDAEIAPDDFVFLRPMQTEATLLQFGDLVVHDGGTIIDRWPVFPASA